MTVNPDAAAGVTLAVQVERRPGAPREDGTLDFREVSFTPTVRPGQILARVPAGLLAPGAGPKAGRGVSSALEDNELVFRASATGVVRYENRVLSVVRELQIDGPVSYHTGNLDFDGDVVIKGAVGQGFTVKATGHLTVGGAVEPGGQIIAGGDLSVAGGILGHRTQVRADGTVQTLFVHEAQVTAAKDILIARSVYMARLRAGGQVRVDGHAGGGGALVGGQAWAGTRIQVQELGGPSHPLTAVMAGADPEKARELDRIRQRADLAQLRLRQVVQRFGLAAIDVDQIRNMIAAAVGPRQKVLANRARQLAELARAYQQLQAQRRVLTGQLATQVNGAEVQVQGTVHPGVEVRIGEHRRQVRQPLGHARFRVVDERLVDG